MQKLYLHFSSEDKTGKQLERKKKYKRHSEYYSGKRDKSDSGQTEEGLLY